jgi:hypothetical protein
MIRLTLTLAVLAVGAPTAPALAETGSATLRLDGPAAAGLRVTATAPASAAGRRVVLPVVGEAADDVRLGGRVVLRGPRGTIALSTLAVDAQGLTAGARTIARRSGADLTATAAVRRRLGLRAGRLGTIVVAASGDLALARPAGAAEVTSATFTWHVRESLIRYVNAGEGTSVADGAVAAPPMVLPGTDAALSYDFSFPLARGWRDAATGRADVRFAGVLRLSYAAHGIALEIRDPELVLDGERSRGIATTTDGAAPTRSVLMQLGPGARMPATVSADGSSLFAGFYLPGDPLGWVEAPIAG